MNKTKLFMNTPWFKEIMPEGFYLHSSVLISGPGGSGKPIIAYDLAREWLQNGDSVILFLTSTTYDYTKTIFLFLGADLEEYKTKNQLFIVEFDPSLDEIQTIDSLSLKANFLKPTHWEQAIRQGKRALSQSKHGVLMVASALNLLYFSPSYRESIHKYLLQKLMDHERDFTLLWTVNSQAYKSFIDRLEEKADVLMISKMDKDTMALFVEVLHAKNLSFTTKPVKIPITKEIIKRLKEEAEAGRKHLIPQLKKI